MRMNDQEIGISARRLGAAAAIRDPRLIYGSMPKGIVYTYQSPRPLFKGFPG